MARAPPVKPSLGDASSAMSPLLFVMPVLLGVDEDEKGRPVLDNGTVEEGDEDESVTDDESNSSAPLLLPISLAEDEISSSAVDEDETGSSVLELSVQSSSSLPVLLAGPYGDDINSSALDDSPDEPIDDEIDCSTLELSSQSSTSLLVLLDGPDDDDEIRSSTAVDDRSSEPVDDDGCSSGSALELSGCWADEYSISAVLYPIVVDWDPVLDATPLCGGGGDDGGTQTSAEHTPYSTHIELHVQPWATNLTHRLSLLPNDAVSPSLFGITPENVEKSRR